MDELINKLAELDRLDLYNTDNAVWLDEVIEVVRQHYKEDNNG